VGFRNIAVAAGLHAASSWHAKGVFISGFNVSLICDGQIEKELGEICSSILQLLDDHLIPTAPSGESKVFYLKMKGDYHRYLAEFKVADDRKEAAEHTLLAYKAAQVRL
jgi:hypothetical protein